MPPGYSRIPHEHPLEPDLEAAYPPSTSTSSSPPLGSSSSPFYPPPRPVDAFSYPPPLSSAQTTAKRGSLGASRKGKERAVEIDEEGGGGARGPGGLTFCVRFTDGQTEDLLDLWVGEKEPVKEVKRRIRLLRPSTLFTSPSPDSDPPTPPKPRRLRLIQLGRLLPDGVLLVPYTNQLNAKRAALSGAQGDGGETAEEKIKRGLEMMRGVVREVERRGRRSLALERERGRDEVDEMERGEAGSSHPLFGEEDEEEHKRKGKGKEKEKEGAGEGGEDTRIWLHCSVGEAEEEEVEGGEKATAGEGGADEPSSQITPLTGFDRLLDSGFSAEDVANLRAEFRERRGLEEDEGDEEEGGEGNEEHRRALEEQWMSGLTGQEEAMGDSSAGGYTYSLLKGVCIGFFVPFLPLFFFRSQIFSKRMQMAIVLGILMNIGFGILRLLG